VSDTTAIERPVTTAAAPVRDSLASDRRYLTFRLGGDVYALDILDITEIIEFRKLTVVPMMPPFIRGVINLRGRVLPVIDLASRFGQPATTIQKRTGIIVIETHVGHDDTNTVQGIGILVDAVNKVIHLGPDDMEPAPDFGAGIRSDFIDGMAKHDEQFLIVLDIDKVLGQHDLATVTSLQAAAHHPTTAE
jgi:purine-binding chemotaxis protein CheW